ncbi:MAG: type II toxin-antitoxin system VapB family antitoxin [Verrucomicrobia bacterium]|nr:type II toxin-antitoxin system VapB family antitoxin [Verrucomicrobiota bacterium]
MKTVLDIPDKEMKQAIKNAGVRSKDEAVLIAVREFNRRRRLSGLAARLKGSLPGFMGQGELKTLREDARWRAAK